MPNIMVMSAIATRNSQCAALSGASTSASRVGTPVTPIRYWNTEATASRKITDAVRIALS